MKRYYIKVNSSHYLGRRRGDFCIVDKINEAVIYPEKDKEKLTHIIDSIPRVLKKNNPRFSIAYYEDQNTQKIEVKNKTHVEYKDKNVTIKDMSNVIEEISYCTSNQTELVNKLIELQQTQNDILHYIELYKFSASEGYMLCKKLQDVRTKRREVKNKIEISKTCSKEAATFNDVMNKLENIQCRTYSPRYLQELFQKNEGRLKQ